MREHFHDDLDALSGLLVEMTRLVGSAIARATVALLDSDLSMAESVISSDEQVDALQHEFEERSLALLALQQPVATDLRVIVAGLRMSSDLERMGDLARHVAKLARMRHPRSAIPPELRSTMIEMGQVAERIVAKTGSVIAGARPGGRDRTPRPTMTPWTPCTERSSPCCWTTRGPTASKRPSTSPCAAATTNDSPITPSRWPGGWSSWSPASESSTDLGDRRQKPSVIM